MSYGFPVRTKLLRNAAAWPLLSKPTQPPSSARSSDPPVHIDRGDLTEGVECISHIIRLPKSLASRLSEQLLVSMEAVGMAADQRPDGFLKYAMSGQFFSFTGSAATVGRLISLLVVDLVSTMMILAVVPGVRKICDENVENEKKVLCVVADCEVSDAPLGSAFQSRILMLRMIIFKTKNRGVSGGAGVDAGAHPPTPKSGIDPWKMINNTKMELREMEGRKVMLKAWGR
ncbi:hypothetical protein FNV43_RR26530 [Rhamnella rubrinervis]|uniref:Uncharacterized protein n=1 Tax=Rhamnella rubrinervis TaxID=2594499 RepID=A0A8K0DPH2_9ROSA|nr:hypothetical protein FNV43_RR26530 [Rhamnella rubrinervis]